MVTPLVTSLLHFHQYNLFKNMVYIFALFGLFWVLLKKLGDFYLNHLVTLAFPALFAINLIVLDNDERSSLFHTSVFRQKSFIAFSCGFLLMASLGSMTFSQIPFVSLPLLGMIPLV
jgi:hypothetical protein